MEQIKVQYYETGEISNKVSGGYKLECYSKYHFTSLWPVIFCQHFLTSVCFFAGFSSGRISGLSANLTQSSEVSRSSVAAIATPSRQRRTGSRRGRRLKLFRKTTFLVNDQELGAGNMGYQVFKRGIQNLYIFLAKNQHYFKERVVFCQQT